MNFLIQTDETEHIKFRSGENFTWPTFSRKSVFFFLKYSNLDLGKLLYSKSEISGDLHSRTVPKVGLMVHSPNANQATNCVRQWILFLASRGRKHAQLRQRELYPSYLSSDVVQFCSVLNWIINLDMTTIVIYLNKNIY